MGRGFQKKKALRGGGGGGRGFSKGNRQEQQRRGGKSPAAGRVAFKPRPPPPLPEALSSLPKFVKKNNFSGRKLGYFFSRGKAGVGYYVDRVQIGAMGDKLRARLAATLKPPATAAGDATKPAGTKAVAGSGAVNVKSPAVARDQKPPVGAGNSSSSSSSSKAIEKPSVAAPKLRGDGSSAGESKRTIPAAAVKDGGAGSDEALSDGGSSGEESSSDGDEDDGGDDESDGGGRVARSVPNGQGGRGVKGTKEEEEEDGKEGEAEEEEEEEERGEEGSSNSSDGEEEKEGEEGGEEGSSSDSEDEEAAAEEKTRDRGTRVRGVEKNGDNSSGEERPKEPEADEPPPEDIKASFESLGVTGPLCEAAAQLGWTHATEIQRQALPLAFEGKDVIGLAETGSGKTGAFALPILQALLENPQRLFAVVMAPTRELAFQINEVMEALGVGIGLKTVCIVGGIDMFQQSVALALKPHVVIATPGRLVDHLENTKGFSLRTAKYLVLDEADRMLGMDFEEEINKVLSVLPRERRTFLFSATMTSKVAKLQRASLKNPVRVEVANKFSTPKTLVQQYLFIPAKHKDCYLAYVLNEFAGQSTIVFVSTCNNAQRVALLLRNLGFQAVCLHGQMGQPKRLGALGKFKSGQRNVLIATDVASRGLDIPSV
ncbi:unnamed protein product, partial [Ectocarpus sp. 4 AP-2014]